MRPLKTSCIMLLLSLLASVMPAYALHPRPVQILEGHAQVGISFPLQNYRGGHNGKSASLGLEGRVNFPGTGWDCGLGAYLSCAERRFGEEIKDVETSQNNRTIALLVTSHFNFNQGGKCNPFAGIGIGPAYCDVVGTRVFPMQGWQACVAPCVGMEFVTHARISLQFNLTRRGFNNFSLSFGAVIGGGPKHKSANKF